MTQHGVLIGTPAYMSPEQIRGQEATAQSDLYCCGAMLYEMLVGRELFPSDSVMEVLALQLHTEPTPLREAAPERQYSQELERVVHRALAKDPAQRYRSVAEFRHALGANAERKPSTAGICVTCGTRISLGTKFCPECGARLGADSFSEHPAIDLDTFQAMQAARGMDTAATMLGPSTASDESPAAAHAAVARSTAERLLRTTHVPESQLVCRAEEREVNARFMAGAESILEIVAAVGAGKTTLLEDLTRQALHRGFRVFATGADPSLARVPWYPIRALVSQILELGTITPTADQLSASLGEVGLVPEDVFGLSLLFGLSQPGEVLEHAVRRRELYAATLRVLLHSAPVSLGACLFVDDSDELDGASIALLGRLCGAASHTRVKIVVAGVSSILPERCEHTTLIPKPLDGTGIRALTATLVSGAAAEDATLITAVAQATQGNAFHVMESLRLLSEGGDRRALEGSVAELVARRLERLSPEAQRLLRIVCALGWGAPVETAKSLYQNGEGWIEALSELYGSGFLLPDSGESLSVSHRLVAEGVREAMPVAEWQSLHRQIVELSENSLRSPMMLARHSFETKLGRLALELLENAAYEAESWLDDGGAAIYFQRALHVARWELLLGAEDKRYLEVSLKLADSLRYSGNLVAADVVLKETLAASKHNQALNARAHCSLARLELAQNRRPEAVTAVIKAVGQAVLVGDSELLTEMYIELGRVLALVGEMAQGVTELEEGLLMLTGGEGLAATQGPPGFWRLLVDLAWFRSRTGRKDLALETAKRALWHAERERSKLGMARCHHLLGDLCAGIDQVGEAERHHQAAQSNFIALGDRRSTGECMMALARESTSLPADTLSRARELIQQIALSRDSGS